MKIRFEAVATAELEEALRWYRARSETAERGFARAVDSALGKILASPERFGILSQAYRGCRVLKYPYVIVYRLVGEVVAIVAIAHTSRRPGYWKRRK